MVPPLAQRELAPVTSTAWLLAERVPAVSVPVPAWFCELTEAVAGQRLSDAGVAENVSSAQLVSLKSRLLSREGGDFYTRWAKWFLADRESRCISLSSSMTTPEFVERRIRKNTLE